MSKADPNYPAVAGDQPPSEAEAYAQQQREGPGAPPPSGYAYNAGGPQQPGSPHQGYVPQPQQYAQPVNPAGVQPIPGLAVRGPLQTPQPGDVITGWEMVEPQKGCSCDLKTEGWLVVIILLLVFPCVACIPCCIRDCFNKYQVPVYGPPGSTMSQNVPVAQPYQQP